VTVIAFFVYCPESCDWQNTRPKSQPINLSQYTHVPKVNQSQETHKYTTLIM